MVLVARFDMGIYVHVLLFWIPAYLFLCFYVGPCAERQTSNIMLSAGHKVLSESGHYCAMFWSVAIVVL